MNNKPLAVYVHFPYCQRKCKYCDFISFTDKYGTEKAYSENIVIELSRYDLSEYEVRSVFFGGGTPSSVDKECIRTVLSAIREKCRIAEDAEITVECNPNSLSTEKLLFYRQNGVNRISIGIQSFDNDVLKTLGRLHDADTAVTSIKEAKKAGFDNVSCDLMFSIPGQTAEKVISSVKTAASLGADHISLYSLIIEDGTEMEKLISNGILSAVDDKTDREMYSEAITCLKENGYLQYEVSNFAKPGKESRHNIAYWERREYIGLGVAAHSFFNGKRYSNTESFDEYMRFCGIGGNVEEINEASAAEETIMLGLRMNKGFFLSTYDIGQRCKNAIEKLQKEGLVVTDGERLFATDKGRDVLNKVILDIVSEL